MAFDIPPVPSWLGNTALTRFLNDLRQALANGAAGTGTVTSITATSPIVVTPSPITTTGVVSHAASGVTPGTYGDSTHTPRLDIDAKGHVTAASSVAIATASGTVVSVAQTVPVEFSVAGSPVTSSGTLAISKVVQNANTVWAGPVSGSPAVPVFRALTGADLPGFNLWLFGNGADGNVHFDGTNTFAFAAKTGNSYFLLRPIYTTDCTIDTGISVLSFDWQTPGANGGSGQQIFCTGTFTNNGLCGCPGQRNTINKKIGGLGQSSGNNGIYLFGSTGGLGGSAGGPTTGGAGVNVTGYGGAGGAGGASSTPNNGGVAGTVNAIADADSGGINQLSMPLLMQGGRLPSASTPFWQRWGGGSGGGGGGAVSGTVDGGGGGAGGGPFLVCARYIATAGGHLSCDGADGNTGSGGSGNGGGGGGGGGGGVNMIITTTPNPTSLLSCTAAGGIGGARVGGIGTSGSNGNAGRVITVVVN